MSKILKLIFASLLLAATTAHAGSFEDLRESFLSQGVPAPALDISLEFLEDHAGHTMTIQHKDRSNPKKGWRMVRKSVPLRTDYMAILDFSRPSEEQRFFLLNLKTGEVKKYLVSHGRGSGVRWAYGFSNVDMSKMTSLGFYLTGDSFQGGHGTSVNLYGLETSNNLAAYRDILLHGADYATESYIKRRGRLGRSWGCAAVGTPDFPEIFHALKPGSLMYFYQADLMTQAKLTPKSQVTTPPVQDDPSVDFPDEEEGIQNSRK